MPASSSISSIERCTYRTFLSLHRDPAQSIGHRAHQNDGREHGAQIADHKVEDLFPTERFPVGGDLRFDLFHPDDPRHQQAGGNGRNGHHDRVCQEIEEIQELHPEHRHTGQRTIAQGRQTAQCHHNNANAAGRFLAAPAQFILKGGNGTLGQSNGACDRSKKDQKEEVTLTANLQYMEYSSSYEIKVIVCGRELTHEEQLKKDIFYEIKCAQSDYNSDYVELPKEVDGEEVIYKKRESGNYAAAVLFCGISLAIFAHYHDKEKKNSYEKEKIKQMKCDYPEIVAKLSLLVGAGMTVRMAWEKIVVDYRVRQKSGSKKRYAYEFMSEGLNMLKSGKPQIYVYEEFGMKCGIKEYMKFSSLIVQNIKKGTKELALLLTLEAKDAFEERKNMAKKYGEEAGTKLLLPMIIMLIVVMAIIMVPALMSFSGY